jgi:hypothetical protein
LLAGPRPTPELWYLRQRLTLLQTHSPGLELSGACDAEVHSSSEAHAESLPRPVRGRGDSPPEERGGRRRARHDSARRTGSRARTRLSKWQTAGPQARRRPRRALEGDQHGVSGLERESLTL